MTPCGGSKHLIVQDQFKKLLKVEPEKNRSREMTLGLFKCSFVVGSSLEDRERFS